MGPIPVTHCRLFFFFSIPKLTESSEKKKRKEKRNLERTEVEKKKKKKNRIANQEKKGKKKKVKSGQKLRLGTVCGSPYVCLITILPLSYELWKLKTAKMCFQFP